MFLALRVIICFIFLVTEISAGEFENNLNQLSISIRNQNERINKIFEKAKHKNLLSEESKKIKQEKENLILSNFRLNINRKILKKSAQINYANNSEKLLLRYSPKGVCKNPCELTMEAIKSKKLNNEVVNKYIFYVDEKPIESKLPNFPKVYRPNFLESVPLVKLVAG